MWLERLPRASKRFVGTPRISNATRKSLYGLWFASVLTMCVEKEDDCFDPITSIIMGCSRLAERLRL